MNTDSQRKPNHSPKRVVKILGGLFLILVVLVGLLAVVYFVQKRGANRERVEWKDAALQRLAGMSLTNSLILQELSDPNTTFGWIHDNVLVITNGEYIVYASKHGANSGFVDHLFLGHCSDGRWIYSTYHFCNSMAGAFADSPGSIAEFSEIYSAREFDGVSDECLKHTCPPED